MKPCLACFADPGPDRDADDAVEADPVDLADEQWCRDHRDALIKIAHGLTEFNDAEGNVSRISAATVIKAYDCALKFHRGAREARQGWKEPQRDDGMFAEFKKLRGKGRAPKAKPH